MGVVCCWCDAWTTFEIAVIRTNELSDEVLASHSAVHGPHNPDNPNPQQEDPMPDKPLTLRDLRSMLDTFDNPDDLDKPVTLRLNAKYRRGPSVAFAGVARARLVDTPEADYWIELYSEAWDSYAYEGRHAPELTDPAEAEIVDERGDPLVYSTEDGRRLFDAGAVWAKLCHQRQHLDDKYQKLSAARAEANTKIIDAYETRP